MLVFAFWVLGVALIVAQTTFLQYLPLWLVRPDFVFILVTFIAYRFAWIPGLVLVFSLGMDNRCCGRHLSRHLPPRPAWSSLPSSKELPTKRLIKESTYQIPLVGLCYFLMQIFFYFIYSVLLPEELPEWSWVVACQRTSLVVFSAIPLFMLFNSLYEYIQKRRLRGKATTAAPSQSNMRGEGEMDLKLAFKEIEDIEEKDEGALDLLKRRLLWSGCRCSLFLRRHYPAACGFCRLPTDPNMKTVPTATGSGFVT